MTADEIEAPAALAIGEAIEIADPTDDYRLAATLFRPSSRPPHVCVIVNSGAAIPRGFYSEFGEWLASRGAACVTYDYRGMFDSVALNQAEFEVSALSWGARDLTSVIAWCETRFPGVVVTCVGHSLGGHIVALSESVRKLRRFVLVTCGSVYWGFRPTLISKASRIGFWYLLLPASTYLFGRFPGHLLSIMDDLPRDVALQWARWCRHPGYLKGAESDATYFDAVTAPVLSLHFDDDKEIPFEAVQAFAACFPKTPVEIRLVKAADVPTGKIGHFNFFRSKVAATLWPELFAWLTA